MTEYVEVAEAETQVAPREENETAFDHVSPAQEGIHRLLVRWGAWVRARSGGGECGSIESFYERGSDGTPPSTAPLGPDPELLRIERAMLYMPRERAALGGPRWISEGRTRFRVAQVSEKPGMTLRLVYAYRWTPATICDALVPNLRPIAWAAHITVHRSLCRSLVAGLTT